jgi:hypothetical protein
LNNKYLNIVVYHEILTTDPWIHDEKQCLYQQSHAASQSVTHFGKLV